MILHIQGSVTIHKVPRRIHTGDILRSLIHCQQQASQNFSHVGAWWSVGITVAVTILLPPGVQFSEASKVSL